MRRIGAGTACGLDGNSIGLGDRLGCRTAGGRDEADALEPVAYARRVWCDRRRFVETVRKNCEVTNCEKKTLFLSLLFYLFSI
jgi:hypothetical protein